ncbi:MAG: DUF4129 domain-containing protein [Candidatus Hydrogenedentes bacterium]|nr:DUF4129 domain-containing protein [Candidatus Hydrogenedentota bacterium]
MIRLPGLASTDFHSLMRGPDPGHEPPPPLERRPDRGAADATDFHSLKMGGYNLAGKNQQRTATDYLIDFFTPFLLFCMVYSVVTFLMDVRYIYTEEADASFRAVAFCFIMGVVALNRLIAREGSQESMLYIGGLAGAIGFYTFSITGFYDNPNVARNFLNDSPAAATAVNMAIVAFLWWLVNRLTHECCVDENSVAGEIGILTGTARRFQRRMQRQEAAPRAAFDTPKRGFFGDPTVEDMLPMNVLEPFDPTEGWKPKEKPQRPGHYKLSDRLAEKHPGISILFFSIPVLIVFSIGLRVVQQGGSQMVMAGKLYMGVYTFCSLMLLMFTSLGGLREYFRRRRVQLPPALGWFWMLGGFVMVVMVMVGASQLHMPGMPPMAYVDEHVRSMYNRTSTFQLPAQTATPVQILEQSQFMDYLGKAVLVLFVLFGAYCVAMGLLEACAAVGRNRHQYPDFVVRFFDRLEKVLSRMTRMPRMPKRRRRIRIQPVIATSGGFNNLMSDTGLGETMTANNHVEHAYAALCALAYDMGVPRAPGETPYEYLARFPKELEGLRAMAEDLTQLYVIAAYSPVRMDERVQDRLRKFWVRYTRIRGKVVR